MMTVYDVLRQKINELKSSAQETLVTGAPKDYPQYRELCGYIRGLEAALREVNDLAQSQQEMEDD